MQHSRIYLCNFRGYTSFFFSSLVFIQMMTHSGGIERVMPQFVPICTSLHAFILIHTCGCAHCLPCFPWSPQTHHYCTCICCVSGYVREWTAASPKSLHILLLHCFASQTLMQHQTLIHSSRITHEHKCTRTNMQHSRAERLPGGNIYVLYKVSAKYCFKKKSSLETMFSQQLHIYKL